MFINLDSALLCDASRDEIEQDVSGKVNQLVYLSVVILACGNFASANKPANSAVIKKTYLFPVTVDILDDLLEHRQFGTKEH